jgi:Exostosin family
VKFFLSSCVGPAAASRYCTELVRLATLDRAGNMQLVTEPESADLILIVDIFEANLYRGLRQNPVWQQWPEKSFAYYEGDCPPDFLHGLHSSARKSQAGGGRFQGCAYPLHQHCYPNPCPPPAEIAAASKDLLFSFAGRASHRVRRQLFSMNFNRADVLVEDTSSYNHFGSETENYARNRQRYWQTASRSKFALCPRGAGTSSIRLFEMMEAGIAPVIIADDWLPPVGPRWEDFALFVAEADIGSLYEKIKARENEFARRGQLARQAWEQFFSPENYWSFMLAAVERIKKNQTRPESHYTRRLPLLVFQEWSRQQRIQSGIWLKSRVKKLFSRN